jgi:spermidine synthase
MNSSKKEEPSISGHLSRYQFGLLLVAVFTVSFGILAFEITLTRIFSVKFLYHYAFLSVSLAFAGLVLGGIASKHLLPGDSPGGVLVNLAATSMLLSVLAPILVLLVAAGPGFGILSSSGLTFIPFFLGGILLATMYKVFSARGSLLYFADLVGAAVGSLAILPILSRFDAITTVVLIGVISSAGSVLLASATGRKKVISLALVILVSLMVLGLYLQTIESLEVKIAEGQRKELQGLLSQGAQIVESRWSLFGRTDLVELGDDPDMKAILVDGGAGSRMLRFNGNPNSPNSKVRALRYSTAYYPYYSADKESALIIGPGGGVDVLMALMAGVKNITAVEVNPETVAIVQEQSDFNGGIYTEFENVRVVVEEGRSFLRRSTEEYDVIMLNIPVTNTLQGTSGYSLAENYLFTTESFKDYLNHLGDDGYLVVVAHMRAEIYKLVTIAIKVFQEEGLSNREIRSRMVATEEGGMFPVFMVKKSGFASEEIGDMYAKSKDLGFTPIYFPYVDLAGLDAMLVDVLGEDDPVGSAIEHFRDRHRLDVEPPVDNSPFFYRFEVGLPGTVTILLGGSAMLGLLVLFGFPRGQGPNPSRRGRRKKTGNPSPSPFLAFYFLSLGLGFMLIEVSLIQRFILFLGHPTVAVSVTVFSLLVSSGLGSLYSRRWKPDSLQRGLQASLVAGVLAIVYLAILPPLFDAFLGFGLASRFFVSVLVTSPIGFFLGMPFPIAVRFLSREMKDHIPWMWGLNGAFSLMGSILATVLAITTGFAMAFLLGGLSYIGIFSVGRLKLKANPTGSEVSGVRRKRRKNGQKRR